MTSSNSGGKQEYVTHADEKKACCFENTIAHNTVREIARETLFSVQLNGGCLVCAYCLGKLQIILRSTEVRSALSNEILIPMGRDSVTKDKELFMEIINRNGGSEKVRGMLIDKLVIPLKPVQPLYAKHTEFRGKI